MAIENQESQRSSQTTSDELCFVVPPTSRLLRPPQSTGATITIGGKYKGETLESKKEMKKPRLGSWWDEAEVVNELSVVVNGLPKPKDNDDEPRVDHSYTDVLQKKKDDERSFSSTSHHESSFIDLTEDESENGDGNGHVTFEELGVWVEDLKALPWEAFDPTWEIRSEAMDPWLGGYIEDMFSPNSYN
ncbi:unnamed protein product [Microthlaspi erraticum]|uniref:Uncharacterized protein n=1 Tax=Microthlaspi erraticum TaxID=1685480 RepID=A0A6D2K3J5_9BRAS|nr:unnamed protein product [Microthlaspi erraticum]